MKFKAERAQFKLQRKLIKQEFKVEKKALVTQNNQTKLLKQQNKVAKQQFKTQKKANKTQIKQLLLTALQVRNQKKINKTQKKHLLLSIFEVRTQKKTNKMRANQVKLTKLQVKSERLRLKQEQAKVRMMHRREFAGFIKGIIYLAILLFLALGLVVALIDLGKITGGPADLIEGYLNQIVPWLQMGDNGVIRNAIRSIIGMISSL